jgi:hypothetical protein
MSQLCDLDDTGTQSALSTNQKYEGKGYAFKVFLLVSVEKMVHIVPTWL